MLLAHRPTEELIAVEHADLGHIAWIVADSDRLADISGERGLAVAKTKEADAVAPHPARLGVVHEQQVEAFQALRQSWQQRAPAPCVEGNLADFRMDAHIVALDEVRADRPVELSQG